MSYRISNEDINSSKKSKKHIRLDDDDLRNNRKLAKKGKLRKGLTFWCEDEIYYKVKNASEEMGISNSRFCLEAVRLYLEEIYGD